MKPNNYNIFLAVIITIFYCFQSAFCQQKDYAKYVNPFIGTGGTGHTFPGATLPFGIVQVSPETGIIGWNYCAGYRYEDSTIMGFSHTHLSGTGAMDLADVLLLPFTGPVLEKNYKSSFSHKEEKASPGYYAVKLKDFDVNAEVTATEHAAMHRYTYPNAGGAHLLIDLKHGLVNNMQELESHVIKSEINNKNSKTITGYRITKGWGGERHVYFVIQFSQPFTNYRQLNDTSIKRNQKLVVDFNNADKTIRIKVGLSTVSIDNAARNIVEEIPGWNFENVCQQARKKWNGRLGSINADGADIQKEIFYTALYHSFIAPNNIADRNGQYRGADNKVYTAGNRKYYSTLSLWDTYRALNPLFTIIAPGTTNYIVTSMLEHYKVAGYLPVWTLWGHENHCMIANHAIPVIVDAYLKGIKNYDVSKAYEDIKISSTVSHKNSDWEKYMRYGYLPSDSIKVESASTTLESAYDDWCVAQMATKLGKRGDAELFSKRSRFYKNIWDSSSQLMRGRKSTGEWTTPFDPLKISHAYSVGGDFTEGNAWHYTWHVQQDVDGLIALMGGRKKFIQKLDSLFTMDSKVAGEGSLADVTGLIGQYVQGNEPSHHVAYLYAMAGAPSKTQEKINTIANTLYNNTPIGLSGNDDCGQMSAWYVFSAMGFYPVNPASGLYVLGAPQLNMFSIKVNGGKLFTIKATNLSGSNKYVQKVLLNGRVYTEVSIRHSDIMKGGVLEFDMGKDPVK